MNPHIYTHVEVKGADGKPVVYRVEGGPPNALFRQGWRMDSLKIGDTVTVHGIAREERRVDERRAGHDHHRGWQARIRRNGPSRIAAQQ